MRVVATAVGAEGSRRTLGKRGQGGRKAADEGEGSREEEEGKGTASG